MLISEADEASYLKQQLILAKLIGDRFVNFTSLKLRR